MSRQREDEHDTLQSPPGAPASEPGGASLLVYHRDGAELVPLSSGAGLVLGREAPSDVAIRDRSLSRRHARFIYADGAVWIEDLGSTNGTRINGEPLEGPPRRLAPGDDVRLGSVTVSIHLRAERGVAPGVSGSAAPSGLEGHEVFRSRLEEEVRRARYFGRRLALVMLRATDHGHAARWAPRIARALRPVDRVALYAAGAVEVLMPEAAASDASALARALIEGRAPGEPALVAGVAVYPEASSSGEGLIEAARTAVERASAREPVVRAEDRGAHPCATGAAAEAGVVDAPGLTRLLAEVDRIAGASISVLITGETGSGKEIVARRIHARSGRGARPLVAVNCGAIPAQLVESTLFGHERGAFTGAVERAQGVFEAAEGGTVFLDEVGELPAAAQAALLRVLETRRVVRVGSSRELVVDVRVVTATHRDLEAMSREGKFRLDLYYRLNAITLSVPPLRERPEDIAPLVSRFVLQANRANGRAVQGVDATALALLRGYQWPGNVRELRNAIERAVVIALDELITPEDLPNRVRARLAAPSPVVAPSDGSLRERLHRFEAALIQEALRAAGGDRNLAADRLDLPLRTLNHKIRNLHLKRGPEDDAPPEGSPT